MSKFKVTSKIDGNTRTHLQLYGTMDEHSDYSSVPSILTKEVVVDFNNVEHINSIGIKHWVQWLPKLIEANASLKFYFVNCPKTIVDQINMVDGFLPKGCIIQSFKVPFYCEECDESATAIFVLGREYSYENEKLSLNVPTAKCKVCSNDMELDVVEKRYFHFLQP